MISLNKASDVVFELTFWAIGLATLVLLAVSML
jgi:hypothetical protein